jgi:hypothetical protein
MEGWWCLDISPDHGFATDREHRSKVFLRVLVKVEDSVLVNA